MSRSADSLSETRSRFARNRPSEERRTVTVLFADIVGFTVLADQLDPEDVRALQSRYFDCVKQVIDRLGGVVEKYVGDAVLAVFGAPRSAEDDAGRAVRAGLEIQERLTDLRLPHSLPDGSRIRARVGIATGEAVVDLAAAKYGNQALVSGAVVNTAARVQAYADPGTVVVTAATRRATATMVDYRQFASIVVAGRSAEIDLWQARRVSRWSATGADRDTDRHTAALVGRRAELAELTDSLMWTIRERSPRLVSVVGPSGIGKSRLVRELANRVRAAAEPAVRWWLGHCPAQGSSAGRYEALAEMLRNHAGVRPTDDLPTGRRRLAASIGALVTGEVPPRLLDVLVALLGLPGTQADGIPAEEIERTWRRVLLAAATAAPLVLVVEDVHDADPALVRFLDDLVAAAAAKPQPPALAVVVTRRPDPLGERRGQLTAPGSTLVLRPLTPSETSRLLTDLLDHAGRPAALASELVPLAAGNPRYAEEYVGMEAVGMKAVGMKAVRMEAATQPPALGETPVPERVRSIVSAQLDQVDEADRAVLQAAAVLGDNVWPGAVAALLDTDQAYAHLALRRLERRHLLFRRARSAITDQPEYTFAQVVIRHVAYARLPRVTRIDHHRRVAEWLATTAEAGTPHVKGERARHWSAAGGLACALRRDAEPYLAAARAALAVTSHDDAAVRRVCRRAEVRRRASSRPRSAVEARVRNPKPITPLSFGLLSSGLLSSGLRIPRTGVEVADVRRHWPLVSDLISVDIVVAYCGAMLALVVLALGVIIAVHLTGLLPWAAGGIGLMGTATAVVSARSRDTRHRGW